MLAGGPTGVLSLLLAFAPAAAAIAPAALLGEPVGVPTLSFYGARWRRPDLRAGGDARAAARRAHRREALVNRLVPDRIWRAGPRRLWRPAVAAGQAARRPPVDPARAGGRVARAVGRRRGAGARQRTPRRWRSPRSTQLDAADRLNGAQAARLGEPAGRAGRGVSRARPRDSREHRSSRRWRAWTPGAGRELGPARAVAAAAAGDAWKAIGARDEARAAYARAAALGGVRPGDIGISAPAQGAARRGRRMASRPRTSTPTCWRARRCRRACCRWSPRIRGCSIDQTRALAWAETAARRGSDVAGRPRAGRGDLGPRRPRSAARSGC